MRGDQQGYGSCGTVAGQLRAAGAESGQAPPLRWHRRLCQVEKIQTVDQGLQWPDFLRAAAGRHDVGDQRASGQDRALNASGGDVFGRRN